MITPLEQLTQTLRNSGYSLTNPRRIVFDALQDAEPQTMQQVVKACPGIDQSSVYRVIDLFIKLGIVQKLQIGWKYKLELSDEFHEHHHHLTCQRCGKIIPFEEGRQFEQYLEAIAKQHDFEVREHQLEIQGLCGGCRPQYA